MSSEHGTHAATDAVRGVTIRLRKVVHEETRPTARSRRAIGDLGRKRRGRHGSAGRTNSVSLHSPMVVLCRNRYQKVRGV